MLILSRTATRRFISLVASNTACTSQSCFPPNSCSSFFFSFLDGPIKGFELKLEVSLALSGSPPLLNYHLLRLTQFIANRTVDSGNVVVDTETYFFN